MDLLPKLLLKSSLLLNGLCGMQVHPPNNSDDLYLLFFYGATCQFPLTNVGIAHYNSVTGPALCDDADDDAVLHLRHHRHADVRQHCLRPHHGHRQAQQLQEHLPGQPHALQVFIYIYTHL